MCGEMEMRCVWRKDRLSLGVYPVDCRCDECDAYEVTLYGEEAKAKLQLKAEGRGYN